VTILGYGEGDKNESTTPPLRPTDNRVLIGWIADIPIFRKSLHFFPKEEHD
jgi:hypothetical protein